MKTVMVTQMEKSKLREALMMVRQRAEIMHSIVRCGDQLAAKLETSAQGDWIQLRDTFMNMLKT